MAPFVLNPAEFPPLNSVELTRPPTQQTQSPRFSEAVAPTIEKSKSDLPDFKKFFLAGSNPTSIGTVNTINGRPTIIFSDEETQSLAVDFHYALVGKFSHGSPPYSQLQRLLSNSGIKGSFTVRLINNKHALINLTNESDYSQLWMRRIWYLKGFPMRVFKWSPTFIPDQESSIVPAWFSFPNLPAHLFRKDALHAIAKFVRVPLQIADSTFSRSMLSRARVCIEIDLLKPLVKELDLQINGRTFVQKVEYEQVPQYCSLCKHVEHHYLDCYTKGNAPKPPPHRCAFGTNEATTTKQTKEMKDPPVSMEKGECSKTLEPFQSTVDEHATVDENDEHATVNENDEDNEHIENEENVASVEIDPIETVCTLKNNVVEDVVCALENNVVDDVAVGNEIVGALILRPNNTDCDPMRGMKLINVESTLRLLQSLKKLGVVAKGLKDDEDENMHMNRIALNTALFFQKYFLPPICIDTEAEEHLYSGPRMGRTGRTRKKRRYFVNF
ncbi:UNVERIFIED_CONTAM: hypothetical protein Slati_2718900 [Sesamum latifolium]|uniref:DUF4283 domain-containing protein n=1 Tax=Sesamum latifolium TaxID=2727402 RepID=A0AAW2VZI1_9LAMI